MVKTIIALGREMNMRVTVEGVETSDQVDFLYDANADQVQGFYFGLPLPESMLHGDFFGEIPLGRRSAGCAGAAAHRHVT